uniref:Pre-mRNA-processing factor 19 n=1 Tax=Parastrongyloides trichosuri TaxID=131310 RepID=A0A0N4ZY06_PARTI
MSVRCSISGEVPQEPVVSHVSGNIFEKRLILKFIEENGVDPINGVQLTKEQLTDIKLNEEDGTSAPRNFNTTSIPTILKVLQEEWDACMLNTFNLRKQLKKARQELSHSLYQHDASCRVIARLSNELNAAREALTTLKPHYSTNGNDIHMEDGADNEDNSGNENYPGIGEELKEKLQEVHDELSQNRRKQAKNIPKELSTVDEIKSYKELNSFSGFHSTSNPGITSLSVDGDLSLTGGIDKLAILFNMKNETIEKTFKGHNKKVTQTIILPGCQNFVTSSMDSTIRLWNKDSESSKLILKSHSDGVTDISLHPTKEQILSVSNDSTWAFSDIVLGKTLVKCPQGSDSTIRLACGQFHPDGVLFATGGTDSIVKIWDIRSQENASEFPGHTGCIRTITFSENGYLLASGGDDGIVKLWDLRKLKLRESIDINNCETPINNVTFDNTGTYLAIASSDIHILTVKPWNVITKLKEHTSTVTAVKFGDLSKKIYSVGMDRNLKIYGN